MFELQVTWFFLIGFLLTVYAVLDGFDLGVGFWHLFTKGDAERRVLLNAVGPVWDGNEVWLLTGGGALFAAFPHVYATVFSGLYLALMLVLFALIFRAVSLEFRSKDPSPRWRSGWDLAFALGSALPALLFGVALGNLLRGLPLDASKTYVGGFFNLLNPYALIIGLVGFAMIATHGALYLVIKTEGGLAERARAWAHRSGVVYLCLFVAAGAVTLLAYPGLLMNYQRAPVLWLLPLAALAAIVLLLVFNRAGRALAAFSASALSIVMLMGMTGASLFPRLVPALGDPELSLTLVNSSSSALTLKVMLVIVFLGMPFVIGYTIWTYTVFRGKVVVGEDSY